jgi:diguanylate cyclase (GGDEF)-like protein/PAS domain S-box-containing protein
MRIKSKLVTYLLAISLVPLLITMGLSLGYTSDVVEKLTLQAARERVDTSAEILSAYFSSRIAEVQAYSQSPLVSSMDWHPIREFLRKEVKRHQGVYEKFILSGPSSHFRNTRVGNPAKDDFASFNDKEPNAKLKSIRKRGYWQALIGTNENTEPRAHVSNPMISYTTGVKQVVVGSTIFSPDGQLVGMLGGGIAWQEIEKNINTIRNGIINDYGSEVKLSLVDSDGIYIYHWDPEKVVHLKLDTNGKPVLNDIGEKIVRLSKITEENSKGLVTAGESLLQGNSGYSFYTSADAQQELVALYAPVRAAGYGLIMSIPKTVILAPVANLESYFSVLIIIIASAVLVLAVLTARQVLRRILKLNEASKMIAGGDYEKKIIPAGHDEISELATSFNTMADDLKAREQSLHTEREEAEKVLQLHNLELEKKVEQRTAAILAAQEQLSDFKDAIDEHSIVSMTDLDGTITFANDKFCDISGYSRQELIGQNHRLLNSGNQDQNYWKNMFLTVSSGKTWHDEVRNIAKDGSFYWVKTTIMPALDDTGAIKNYISIRTDITENKQLNEKISYQASHDILTGLVNRREFERRLEQLISRSEDGVPHSVLYLDLDEFKVVNDTCGHHAGDELLRQIPDLIQQHTRKADLVARLGGDEFGIILNACDEMNAEKVSNLILQRISDFQFCWKSQCYKIGVSIGIVVLGDEPTNLAETLKSADSACYAAKDRGRNTVVIYSPSDNEIVNRQEQMNWVSKLTQSLEHDHFVLYAQPIVATNDTESNKISYEILLRMTEGEKVIPPGAFLPAAERYNKITQIDRWVVSNTLSMIKDQHEFLENTDHVSINLSGVSLADISFMNFLVDEIDRSNLQNKICFEITETAAVTNLSAATRAINILHGMGIRFSLDDFGSGLSSFAYLKNLQVDYLKIDGHFVKDIVTDPIDRAMVNSIHEVGSVMGKTTIAEFVENDEILSVLRDIGVNYVQGFGIGKPRPLTSLLQYCNDEPDTGEWPTRVSTSRL